ncbi:Clavaminate synthase-like protein [Ascobolus immersus RN42]|uniref:Clavaminate synthase-like protein n=1 Tax=Ascobolus immersus RN42 TaxID=1160509 RepID=A0A3N4HE80_ASCIM|nr:Clavaminate synthase-like protein [Ascobolus immersus RN42]
MEHVADPYARLLETYHDLNPSFISYAFGPPTPLQFAAAVRNNRPMIFRDALYDADGEEWDARRLWTKEYLLEKMKGREISVAETPWGNADSVIEHAEREVFVKPHTTTQPFDQFLEDVIAGSHLTPSDLDGTKTVKYSQSQDDNLHGEYEPLLQDVPANLHWAAEVFGEKPDAMNLWIGNQNSTSAMHKDNYENLYCLIKGSKTFVLISPLEVGTLRERTLPSATYRPGEDGRLEVVLDVGEDGREEVVHCWPTVDPESPGVWGETEEWKAGRRYEVTVTEGDVLYLPAMWYHKVKQECGEDGYCVAVNYW